MLTRRGISVAVATVALIGAGRLLGLTELYVLAAAGALSLLVAEVYVRLVEFELHCRRLVRPPRVEAGSPCRVDLELTNTGKRTRPPLTAVDPVGSSSGAAVLIVPALPPGQTARAAYEVPTERRGQFQLGPLQLSLVDPFGLASARRQVSSAGTVLVLPRVDSLPGLPPAPGGQTPAASARSARAQGEDFFALRPYQVGDDLRQVHWPSTARVDDLMIRQLELPWQHRVTVVLDNRRSLHDAESFEEAVSAAASILTGSQRAGALTRLTTPSGFDSGPGTGGAHWDALMGALATIGTNRNASLSAALSRLARQDSASSLAVVTTDAAPAADLETTRHLSRRAGLVVLVMVVMADRQPTLEAAPTRLAPRREASQLRSSAGFRVLRLAGAGALPEAWRADPFLSRSPGRAAR